MRDPTTVFGMDDSRDDDVVVVLPWWQNPWNLAVLALAALFLAASAGYLVGTRDDPASSHNAVDTGFLQDMRIHHEQAVVMSRIYRAAAPDGSPILRTIASEIELAQTFEAGRFVQLLRIFGEAETNESDVAMIWMGHSVPLEQMDGMASDEELDLLAGSSGAEADALFARLMIAHHEGGVAMAQYAARHGSNPEVTAMAEAMARAQRGEIAELRRVAGL